MRSHGVMASPIGDLTLVAEAGSLVGVFMDLQKRAPDPAQLGDRDDSALSAAIGQLDDYFAGERTVFDLPLAPRGDEFQLAVWGLLRQIPYGETRSYGDLARELGNVNLSQAVGAANGRNPIAIIVPCHRVIGADGSLVGYAGGLDRKRYLLALEDTAEKRGTRLF